MSPIFCTTNIPHEVIGDHMKAYTASNDIGQTPRRLLVGGMSAKKIMLASPLLKWYLDRGLVVTRTYQAVEYLPKSCFKGFQEEISNARRDGDADKSRAILADTSKLAGKNSFALRLFTDD